MERKYLVVGSALSLLTSVQAREVPIEHELRDELELLDLILGDFGPQGGEAQIDVLEVEASGYGVHRVIEQVFADPLQVPLLPMRHVAGPHFRDLEFRGRGAKSRALQFKRLTK